MSDTLIKVEGVSKKFCRSLKKSLWYGMKDLGREITGRKHGGDGELRPDEFWAVNDVSFELKRGQCLGLIGRNGAGKTTLLRMLNGLIKPDRGRIEMRGRVGALIALGAGFNPILTGRENIYVNASVLGLTKQEIDAKLDEIIDFAEIGEFIDMPVQSYSSGMQVRLGFSIATTLQTDILLLDEVLAVGDREFRAKCSLRLSKYLENAAVIMVSHDNAQIRQKCDIALLLERGEKKFFGAVNEGLRSYTQNQKMTFEPRLISGDSIRSCQLTIDRDPKSSNLLEVTVEIEAKRAIKIDYAVLTIESERGEPAGQSLLSGTPIHLNSGKNMLNLTLEGLSLRPGDYAISFHCNANKVLVFNALFMSTFRVRTGAELWADYQPISRVMRINENEAIN